MKDSQLLAQLKKVRAASRAMRALSTAKKNHALETAANLLQQEASKILKANEQDLKALKKSTPAFRDRLTLSETRIAQMGESLRQVAKLPDPIGEVVDSQILKNGLRTKRVRSPLGVIFMIFESRPNVAVEAFSLAFKAGNAVILRGGSESNRTTRALFEILEAALESNGVTKDCLWGIKDSDRGIPQFLLKQKDWIDVVVPRGGDGLISYVTQNSEIPVIKNDRGLCHVYVHEDADLAMASEIVINAKTQRPGVCNAMETLLVHEKIAASFLPALHAKLSTAGLQWFACPKTRKILKSKDVASAKPGNWDTEYLDLKMNCRVVVSLEEAIAHIEKHGSRHSEVIVSRSKDAATRFESEVDAAAIYWNASSRFTDGFELGLGGELGISTQKLHVRGPVGLKELTSVHWVIEGEGQIRT